MDEVIQLCLESFSSGNLTHFHLEWRKTNWSRMIHEWNGKHQNRTEQYVNGMVRAKISISPMLDLRDENDAILLCYDAILLNVFAPSF